MLAATSERPEHSTCVWSFEEQRARWEKEHWEQSRREKVMVAAEALLLGKQQALAEKFPSEEFLRWGDSAAPRFYFHFVSTTRALVGSSSQGSEAIFSSLSCISQMTDYIR